MTSAFLKRAGLDIAKVPYRDQKQALTDLMEGRLQMYVPPLAIVQSGVDAGKMRIIAVTSRERQSMFPNVPTAIEAGFPALTFDGLAGLFGPRKMSMDFREQIAADIRAVAADRTVAARFEATGQVISIGSPVEFAAAIEEPRTRVAAAARVLGLVPAR